MQRSPEENKIDIKIIRKPIKVKNLNTTDTSINNTFIMHNDSLYTVNNNPSNVLGYHTVQLPHEDQDDDLLGQQELTRQNETHNTSQLSVQNLPAIENKY